MSSKLTSAPPKPANLTSSSRIHRLLDHLHMRQAIRRARSIVSTLFARIVCSLQHASGKSSQKATPPCGDDDQPAVTVAGIAVAW